MKRRRWTLRARIGALLLPAVLLTSGCSRNGEYRYVRELHPLVRKEALIPELRRRLITSEFRKNYDQTLQDRIGSSFRNFKHIRAYQRVLDDTLVYLMLKTDRPVLEEGLRSRIIQTVSHLILSRHTGHEFLTGVDRIADILTNDEDPMPALDRLADRWKRS